MRVRIRAYSVCAVPWQATIVGLSCGETPEKYRDIGMIQKSRLSSHFHFWPSFRTRQRERISRVPRITSRYPAAPNVMWRAPQITVSLAWMVGPDFDLKRARQPSRKTWIIGFLGSNCVIGSTPCPGILPVHRICMAAPYKFNVLHISTKSPKRKMDKKRIFYNYK